jgi:predicted nuclease of predicted toxin-antitoxin system
MIKLLADENFPLASIDTLVANNFDVLSIYKNHSGISDAEIIQLANQSERLILTFDRDFGQLIFKDGLIPVYGIIYFRLQQFSPSLPAQITMDLLNNPNLHLAETITVIDEHFIRQKKL